MRRITWAALVVVFAAGPERVLADPPAGAAVPIPTGTPGAAPFVFLERDGNGTGLSLARRDEAGGWWVWPVAGSTRGPLIRAPLLQTEYSRTSVTAGLRPLAVGAHHELFIENNWSAEVEVETVRLAAHLQWFPIEGVTLGLGFDTRRGLVARCRLGF